MGCRLRSLGGVKTVVVKCKKRPAGWRVFLLVFGLCYLGGRSSLCIRASALVGELTLAGVLRVAALAVAWIEVAIGAWVGVAVGALA